ncbi:Zinc finger BED domain-containing protein 4 [Aphelenchoides avenae]|nr:Zinc finger BED domain-containing protein 4 [Aphelenchus avenae]
MGMRLSTAGFSSSGRPAPRSTVSGLALLSADEWLDVAPFLDYYNNATLRFTSGALNRLVQRNSFTLPRRVIEAIPVGYKDSTCLLGKQYTGYSAEAYTADLQTTWRDLEFGVHETPEAILLEVLTKCQGPRLHLNSVMSGAFSKAIYANFEVLNPEKSNYKCLHCSYSKDIGTGAAKSNTCLKSHLAKNHKKQWEAALAVQAKEKKAAEEAEKLKRERSFFTFFKKPGVKSTDAGSAAVSEKNDTSLAEKSTQSSTSSTQESSSSQRTIHEMIAPRQIDRLIVEMLALDIMPFHTVEKQGFRRFLAYLAPKYQIKSRRYYTETEFAKCYDELKTKVKSELVNANFISFTTDVWSSTDCSHSLLSVTAHFVDDAMLPHFVVLAAKPIDGRHTGANIKDLIECCLKEFEIPRSKVHVFLRDAAKSMSAATRLLDEDSVDCFLHRLHLVVGDGIAAISGFDGRVTTSPWQGLVVTLDLQEFEYSEQVMDVMAQCSPLLTISALWIRGISYNAGSTHEHVLRILEMPMPGLAEVLFENDEAHPDSAAVLSRCVERKIPVVTLAYVADVTEAEILVFLFKNSSASTARQFVVQHLERPLPDDFFEMVVEKCLRNECTSLYFGMDGILTDPTDAKYNRYVVERNVAEAMYKFERASQNCPPFTIVVGRYRNGFSLRVFQGQMVELYTSLASLRKRITPQTAAKWQCQIM